MKAVDLCVVGAWRGEKGKKEALARLLLFLRSFSAWAWSFFLLCSLWFPDCLEIADLGTAAGGFLCCSLTLLVLLLCVVASSVCAGCL